MPLKKSETIALYMHGRINLWSLTSLDHLLFQSTLVPDYSADGMFVGVAACELGCQVSEFSFHNNSDKSTQEECNISCNNNLQ